MRLRFESFNSLQTGKRIQKRRYTGLRHREDVSIPFKRESVSKIMEGGTLLENYSRFNSLQTGKRIQKKSPRHSLLETIIKVSIPFKRESVSKNYDEACGLTE